MMRIAVYISVIAALLLFPDTCAQSARNAISVWGLHVVPSLFPYMVLSKMLARELRQTRFPPAAACMLLGAVGGSPSGASMIASLASTLSPRLVLPLCAFTGTISPMFFLGTISKWTDDPMLPKTIYIAQLIGAALTSACVFLFKKEASLPTRDAQGREDKPLAQSIDAILQIGGCIISFSVLASLFALLPLPKEIVPVVHAILEISGGMHALMSSELDSQTRDILLAWVSGFGGFSILSQNLFFLKPIGISTGRLTWISVLRAFFSSLMMLVFSAR